MKRTFVLAICIAIAAGAFGAVVRTAVSVTGSDTNPCTPAAPCRSFAAALAQTLPDGEVVALDSGGYGPFTISQAVTVQAAPGVYAGVTVPASGTGVTVATNGLVVIRGLTISGPGASAGISSFLVNSLLHVENCEISFVATGLNDFNTAGMLSIDRSVFRDSTLGVSISAGSASTRAELITDSRFESISDAAFLVDSYGDVTIRNSTIAGTSVQNGVWARTGASGGASQSVRVVLENSMIALGNVGVRAEGSGAFVTLSRCAINRNATGCLDTGTHGPGTIRSLGNNNMQDNTAPCAPTVTVSLH